MRASGHGWETLSINFIWKDFSVATFREESALADARKYANAAAFDVQQLPNDLVSQQALRNLLSAVEALIVTVEAVTSESE
jgi:hypothetical protein